MHNNHVNNPWTDTRIALLETLWAAGDTCSAIADKIAQQTGGFFSRNSIIGKVSRMRLMARGGPNYRKTPLTPEQKAERKNRLRRERRMVLLSQGIRPKQYRSSQPRPRRKSTLLTLVQNLDMKARPDHLGIDFYDLNWTFDQCRFPKGEGLAATYCGQPVLDGHSYCPHCYVLTHQRLPDRQRRAA